MAYALGVILFAVGILVSVCLHEAGHMYTAKAFGMKVTRYFVGFGPTLWSFRRGETEYGIKAIPAGGFVKIVGMTPAEDDVAEADQPRAFWRQKVWKRTIVLSAGSLTHFVLGFLLLWVALVGFGVAQQKPAEEVPAVVGTVSACVPATTTAPRPEKDGRCGAGSVAGPAKAAGLRAGDRITSIGRTPTPNVDSFMRVVRQTPAGPAEVTYVRGGQTRTATVALTPVQRIPLDAPADSTTTEKVSAIGIGPDLPVEMVRYGPIEGLGEATSATGTIFRGTFTALGKFPEKVPKLITALTGGERDPETPISVVGASRIGGEIVDRQGFQGAALLLSILASLNIFIGIFNLFPLLPLDGGHIAVVWFERVRSFIAARLGRPDPGSVDYNKLMPLTYAVVLVFGVISVLTIATDVVNPVRLFQ
ncbi:MAG TPA: site-2 protease family protein [Mycobacteriales bacterium]|nr:site-2 protease family protein [Mycobacteriales bacterium]